MRIKGFQFLIFLFVVIFTSCSMTYDMNFMPPTDDTKPEAVFPEKIRMMEFVLKQRPTGHKEVEGVTAIYGNDSIRISCYKSVDIYACEQYFRDSIETYLKTFPNVSSGKKNGKMVGTSYRDSTKVYAWTNQKWLFVIEGRNKKCFNAAVDSFEFVAR